ncbi:hypothetical protein [Chitinimonas lacunae]|uniref:Bacteriocin n=1 Tax=Chitinimonas lacunae TaxID=1963018 RepID=A0ABV8MV95_9NEIS
MTSDLLTAGIHRLVNRLLTPEELEQVGGGASYAEHKQSPGTKYTRQIKQPDEPKTDPGDGNRFA